MLHELDTSDLVKVQKPIFTHIALRVSGGDPQKMKIDRYTYRAGNCTLPRLMAQGLHVDSHSQIEGIEKRGDTYWINKSEFDSVVIATPIPETVRLLETVGEQRPISYVHYRPCLSVLLGYDKEIPEIHYHAIVDPEQRHPLTWLSIESEKCPGRAPDHQTAMVAQLSPQFSTMHYATEDGAIVSATVEYIERLYGKAWSAPVAFDVKRWQYSQPENLALFDNVNYPSAKLVIASDGLIGGRVEYAYEAGARAAKLLIDQG
jgi:predicted NAD/FAD-dependent oxidoreductase